ncbi:hypothetical protein ACIPW5_38075 [Streptomyces sp. NPDC090077]|uniref:hypothetical protein n=1 Tax=Streptomyces sp. NPDC090077 TaxID=3365938 RepID=UPI00380B3C64
MNAVQTALRTTVRRVPARDPAPESARPSRPCPAPSLTTLLRRRVAWGLAAVTRARRTPPARPS